MAGRLAAAVPGGLAVMLVVTFLAFVNYAALLPVVPLWAATGGAGSAGVGATTGVMMAATVATQLATPWLFRLIRLREMMIVGAVLLGAPTPMYLLSNDMGPIVGLTVLRGVGFAFVVLAGATLAADLAPEGRLGRSVSLYGVAAALPNIGALAGGVWAVHEWGFALVIWGVTGTSLVSAVLALALPTGHRGQFAAGAWASVQAVAVPVALFLLTAGSFGAMTTFLPVVVPSATVVATALLAASMALVLARLAAGSVADRHGPGRVLLPAVLACAGGLVLLASGAEIVGAALLGAGFGAAQNDSFVWTVRRLGACRSGAASTIWNIAYDGGIGLGGVAVGWLIGGTGFAGAFLVLAAVIGAVTIILARVAVPPRGEAAAQEHRPVPGG